MPMYTPKIPLTTKICLVRRKEVCRVVVPHNYRTTRNEHLLSRLLARRLQTAELYRAPSAN